MSGIHFLLIVFSKKKVLYKIILLNLAMETQAQTTIIPMEQVPPAAVMQQAGVIERGRGIVSAVRVLGK